MSDYTLHLGDCIAGMAGLGDRSVDHVIADPPYSEHVHKNARSNANGPHAHAVNLGFTYLRPQDRAELARQYARIAKRWVILFCEAEGMGDWKRDLEAAGLEWIRAGFWVRPDSMPQVSSDRPAAGAEVIVIAHAIGTRKRWNAGGKRGVWVENLARIDRVHPTQKPLPLMRALVSDFTDPGELVLDSHMGSGTTGLACLELGRRFLGYEESSKHFGTAEERMRNAQKQESLFRTAPTEQLKLTGAA